MGSCPAASRKTVSLSEELVLPRLGSGGRGVESGMFPGLGDFVSRMAAHLFCNKEDKGKR